ncbi:cytochrome c biogenesis CcdA family protein [Limnochorda pilosa]|uniref:Uncharacterized protein n=1 Tax=Limnochorda pilosa TaxID=1555112 RepID=A0A0K2SQJ5_LIMPI|nr:cytochrome c biogenesis protein CcdA [Limnochorda pilosa]BAS29267.1 hypothetical protein LIP_3455 [Limnochorda pilosa]
MLDSPAIALPVVLAAGLVDGINPCAFTVLLLFTVTLLTGHGTAMGADTGAMRTRVLLLGGTFIWAIFLTYLALGVGLLRASGWLAQNHLGARLGALSAVFLGLWMMKDSFLPEWGPRLGAPAVLGDVLRRWGSRMSFVAMLVLGILVGACTVPCSGAVYLAVLSMLALRQEFARPYVYLVLYNVMFVVPLLVILVGASMGPTLRSLNRWNLHHREKMRLALGTGAVALGLFILATV